MDAQLDQQRFESLYHVTRSLISIENLAEIIKNVADRVVEALPADRVVVVTLDIQAKKVIHFIQGGVGYNPGDILTFEQLDQGLTGWVLRELKPAFSPKDTPDERESFQAQKRRIETGCGDVIVVPLLFRNQILGTMTALNMADGNRLGDKELELLIAMANQISIAIENARLYAEMEKQKRFSESLIENNPVAIVVTDYDKFILSWNMAAEILFGIPEDEAIGKKLDNLITNPRYPELIAEANRFTNQGVKGESIRAITQRCRSDGSTVDVEIYGTPISVDNEKSTYLTLYHDISTLKTTQMELIAARETVEKANQLLLETNRKMERELILAGDIQANFLSQKLPEIPGWDLATFLRPSRETSGDFYDVEQINNRFVSFLIADVVDKGAGAALFMAFAWTYFRTNMRKYYSRSHRLFSKINNHILENIHTNQYMTAFHVCLDVMNGVINYTNAGHCQPLLFHVRNNTFTRLECTGLPLGILHDSSWRQCSTKIYPGDILVLYTDGVTETVNEFNDFFEEERLINVIQNNFQATSQEILQAILYAVDRFSDGNKAQEDDITILVIRRDINHFDLPYD